MIWLLPMRQAYANVKKMLAQYGTTMDNVVEEVLFVTDMDAAMPARAKLKQEVYSGQPSVASTIVQISRLAFPEFLIEIKCIAKVGGTASGVDYSTRGRGGIV